MKAGTAVARAAKTTVTAKEFQIEVDDPVRQKQINKSNLREIAKEHAKPKKWDEDWDLSSIPIDVLSRYWSVYWGSTSGGRPEIIKPCPYCGKPFGGRKLRAHQTQCISRPVVRKHREVVQREIIPA